MPAKVPMVCLNCGSTLPLFEIRQKGPVSCCPERHMISVKELWSRYHNVIDGDAWVNKTKQEDREAFEIAGIRVEVDPAIPPDLMLLRDPTGKIRRAIRMR